MAGGIRNTDTDELDENHEINVTPFIDVMLVLLIIFMVAAPLATVDVAVDLPASNAPPAARPEAPLWLLVVLVAVTAVGGPGSMIAFDLGSKEAAFAALNRLALVSISNNLGDAKSIVTHPATTTHQRLSDEDRAYLGITPGLLRLSIGLEHSADLIDDLAAAFETIGAMGEA